MKFETFSTRLPFTDDTMNLEGLSERVKGLDDREFDWFLSR